MKLHKFLMIGSPALYSEIILEVSSIYVVFSLVLLLFNRIPTLV